MSLDMTPEQKELGKANFNRAVGKLADADQQSQEREGVSRRRFMQGLIAAGATVPISAAAWNLAISPAVSICGCCFRTPRYAIVLVTG